MNYIWIIAITTTMITTLNSINHNNKLQNRRDELSEGTRWSPGPGRSLAPHPWRKGLTLRDCSPVHEGTWWNPSWLQQRVCPREGVCEAPQWHLPANLTCIFQQERFLFILQDFAQSIWQHFTAFQRSEYLKATPSELQTNEINQVKPVGL